MNEPALVLVAFVIRGDSSQPEGHRRARAGYNVNRLGQGVEDAGTAERQLVMTGSPQLEWEAFDEYWRKVHGPKIVHREGPADAATPALGFYLQQHRLPAGPSSEAPAPYLPPLDADGLLDGTPAAHCRAYQRPLFDGLAQLGFDSRQALDTFFDMQGKYGLKIVPDEQVFIRGFAYNLSEEYPVIAGDRRSAPVLLVRLHQRATILDRPAFRGHWMTHHADLVRRHPDAQALVRRYVQLVNVVEAGDPLHDELGQQFDGVGVYSFANMNDCEDFVASAAHAAIVENESLFTAQTSYFTALNYVICDRLP